MACIAFKYVLMMAIQTSVLRRIFYAIVFMHDVAAGASNPFLMILV